MRWIPSPFYHEAQARAGSPEEEWQWMTYWLRER